MKNYKTQNEKIAILLIKKEKKAIKELIAYILSKTSSPALSSQPFTILIAQ